MNDLFSIKNKIIIITGGNGGIGKTLSKKMSEQGGIVYSLDTNFSKKNGKKSKMVQKKCDILNKNQLKNICKEIFENHKKIDVLINCAGITRIGKKGIEYNIEDWKDSKPLIMTATITTKIKMKLILPSILTDNLSDSGANSFSFL